VALLPVIFPFLSIFHARKLMIGIILKQVPSNTV
jgi:hypothetical protein